MTIVMDREILMDSAAITVMDSAVIIVTDSAVTIAMDRETSTDSAVTIVMDRETLMDSVVTIVMDREASMDSAAMVRMRDLVRDQDPVRDLAVDVTIEADLAERMRTRTVVLFQRVQSRMQRSIETRKSVVSVRRKIREIVRI